ncbi:MAG: YihY/virulence factor BrkB family protein [Pirellulaceae bacterium]
MALPIKKMLGIFTTAARQLFADDALTQAAALAFCVTLGLAPMVLMLLSIAAIVGQHSQDLLYGELTEILGVDAAEAVRVVIENADKNKQAGWTAVVVSGATFLVFTSGIFAQVQTALNTVWNVPAPSAAGKWIWLRKRLLTIAMAPVVLLLLYASVAASASVSLLVPNQSGLLRLMTLGISFLLYTAVFSLSFKMLPDVKVAWRDVLVGAVVTAVLFELGKFAIGMYLAYFAVGSAYGAAGSLVVLLVWLYYSSIIFLYGAEITEAWTQEFGAGFGPRRDASRRKREG